MEKKDFDPDQRLPSNYSTTAERFEYLRRLAFNARHNSVNKILDDLAFPRRWRKELEIMRAQHRKLGYNDAEFYHAKIKKLMGHPFKPGRQPIHKGGTNV